MARKLLKNIFYSTKLASPRPIAPGLYHYMREADGTYTRFHLRVEPDNRGLLLVNATAAAQLSPAGVVIAKGILDEIDEETILSQLKQTFRGASHPEMIADLAQVSAIINDLITPGDNYPIINLEDAEFSQHEAVLIAPIQADVTLAKPDQLVPILDRLWEASIPHVLFATFIDPVPNYLVRAVERAEDLGMITGVRGRASDFVKEGLINDMALAGLDHIDLLYFSTDPKVHDDLIGMGDHQSILPLFNTIERCEVTRVATIPLLYQTINQVESTLDSLISAGVYNVNFMAIAAPDDMPENQASGAIPASAMPQTADLVEELANDSEVRFIWQPPVLRDPRLTITQQVQRGPRCSSDLSIRIEPNGDVIPARGHYRKAGNLLTDDWQDIWANDAFVAFRKRIEKPTHCDDCPGLAICAADCPRNMAGWSQGDGSDV